MQSVERTYLTTCSTDHVTGLAGRSGERPFTQPGSDVLVPTSTQKGFGRVERCPEGEWSALEEQGEEEYGEYRDADTE